MFYDLIYQMIITVFGSNLSEIVEVLQMSSSSIAGINVSGVWTFINNIYTYVMLPIGYSIMILYFLNELMDITTSERFSTLNLAKLLFKLVFIKIFMDNALWFLEQFMAIGTALVNSVFRFNSLNNTTTGDTVNSMMLGDINIPPQVSTLLETIKDEIVVEPKLLQLGETLFKPIGISLGYIIGLLIPWAISWMTYFSMNLIAWQRFFEIYLRISVAPIAIADMWNGMNSGGYRYMKAFFAVCLQGVVILMILIIGNQLTSSVGIGVSSLKSWGSDILKLSIIKLIQVSLLMKSLNFSREVLGV